VESGASPPSGDGSYISPSGDPPAADDNPIEALADQISRQLCPLVAIETLDEKPWVGQSQHRPESLLCDITGVAHLFGDESGLLAAVEQLLTAQSINYRSAIADSVGAAWAVAHYGHSNQQIVPPGEDRIAIEPLPVESLRIGEETVATLARLGIDKIGSLLRLPRSGLAPRLGKPLVRRIEQILGEVAEPITVYHPPTEYIAVDCLEYPTCDGKILADRIDGLIKQVRAGLASHQRGALRMTCRLDLTVHPPLTLCVGLFAPTIDVEHLGGLMMSQFDRLKLASDVEQLTLAVPLTGPLRSRQKSLLELTTGSPAGAEPFTEELGGSAISRLVDSLSSRLGNDAVVGICSGDNPLPEAAFDTVPLTGKQRPRFGAKHRRRSSTSSRAGAVSPSPADAMRRPLCLFSEPVPISVAHDDTHLRRFVSSPAVPHCFRVAGTVHSIIRSWGPERIETSWWNGPSIRRDYYRVETDSGQWWWIFRDLRRKPDGYGWMLHGKFT